MSMQDLPMGRRRDDHVIQPSGVSTSPSWDSILDRLARLERSHADLARFVASIHEALPPEIAAATGRTLALGSPIDSVAPPVHASSSAPPIVGIAPPQLPPRVEPPGTTIGVDPYTQTYEAPDPWAAPPSPGDFFQPQADSVPYPAPPAPERKRLFRGRRAAKQAQARIAAEFAAAAMAPHLATGQPMAPPPPPGFAADSVPAPASGFVAEAPSAPQYQDPPSAFGSPSMAPAPGFFGSASEQPVAPPPAGFAFDMAEPMSAEVREADDSMGPSSWGSVDLTSPADLEFDAPVASAGFRNDPSGLAMVPPPPAGFGAEQHNGLSVVPPPPAGFGAPDLMAADVPPPPPGFGAGADDVVAPPPVGYGPVSPGPSDQVFGDLQEMASLITPEQLNAQDAAGALADTGTDRTSYSAVPPITPDFFARASGRGRK